MSSLPMRASEASSTVSLASESGSERAGAGVGAARAVPFHPGDGQDDGEEDADEPHLRGCIGTFSPMPLVEGLREYAITACVC